MKISLLKKNIPLIKLLYFTHIKGKLMWSLDLLNCHLNLNNKVLVHVYILQQSRHFIFWGKDKD